MIRNPVPRHTLPLSREQFGQARGNKAVGFIRMNAHDFLKLTTPDLEHKEWVIKKAAKRTDYMQSILQPSHRHHSIQPAFLKIDMVTGLVSGHEGRHRMASLIKSAEALSQRLGRKIDPAWWVAIILTNRNGYAEYYREPRYEPGKPLPSERRVYLGARHIPTVLTGEFAPFTVTIKRHPFIPIRRG